MRKKVSVSEKKISAPIPKPKWTLVSVPDTETWFRLYTTVDNLVCMKNVGTQWPMVSYFIIFKELNKNYYIKKKKKNHGGR